MAKYKIVKPVDFGPWTIGDKNYGPSCPSCQVPINNYAPKEGDIVEGTIVTRNYYVFYDNKKSLKTGRGISWPIATNGAASMQGQKSDQFITEDHLELYVEPAIAEDPNPSNPLLQDPITDNPSTPMELMDDSCWICRHKTLIIVAILILAILIISSNNE